MTDGINLNQAQPLFNIDDIVRGAKLAGYIANQSAQALTSGSAPQVSMEGASLASIAISLQCLLELEIQKYKELKREGSILT
jgi:hypothetical protein